MSDPLPTTYQPAEAARLLGISRTSLRRYADEFATMLPNYQHHRDTTRTFTAGDLGILAAILDEMARQPEGTTREQLHAYLVGPTAPTLAPRTFSTVTRDPTTPGQATREAAQGDVGSSSTPALLATTDAALAQLITASQEASSQAATALDGISAAVAQLISQQAAAEARREARERRGEAIQWIVATVLIVATVAALVILATVGR